MTASPRFRRLVWPLVLLLLAAAVLAERGRWFGRLLGVAAPERLWIWVAAWPSEVTPRAFFLVRDFELAEVPPAASLEVLADPEFLVRLNNVRVGSGAYRPGDPIATYEVAAWLRPGRNRLQLELRSPIGSGGATLRLVGAGGRELVASDGEWRVYQSARRTLARIDEPLPAAARAAVLGRSPLARWGLPAAAARPSFLEVVAADELRLGARWRPAGAEEWRELPARGGRRPIGVGEVAEIDFGEEVAGYLHLEIEPSSRVEGMLFFASTAGATLERSPDRIVVGVPRLGYWQDVEPRRIRYLTIVGLPNLRGVAIVPLRDQAALVEPRPTPGMFGLPVEPARSPLVEELRRTLLSHGDSG